MHFIVFFDKSQIWLFRIKLKIVKFTRGFICMFRLPTIIESCRNKNHLIWRRFELPVNIIPGQFPPAPPVYMIFCCVFTHGTHQTWYMRWLLVVEGHTMHLLEENLQILVVAHWLGLGKHGIKPKPCHGFESCRSKSILPDCSNVVLHMCACVVDWHLVPWVFPEEDSVPPKERWCKLQASTSCELLGLRLRFNKTQWVGILRWSNWSFNKFPDSGQN